MANVKFSGHIAVGVSLLFLVLSVTPVSAAPGDPILWNRLGSDAEVTHSALGPNLGFSNDAGQFGQIGNPAYVAGVFGNGLTLGPGGYQTPLRVRNAVWESVDQFLNPNRGTIEMWFKQNSNPVGFDHGVYRLFDGSYGLGSGIGMTSEIPDNVNPRLFFGMDFGGANVTVATNISPMNGTWIHVAGVWDRNGIANSLDTIRLYVNGALASSTQTAGWGTTVGQRADIGGGNDANIAGQFAIDNLKVYDYALTDFSHRSQENWLPEPSAAVAAIAMGALMLRRRVRGRVD